MEIDLLDWIFLALYVGVQAWVIWIKKEDIWRGICGGNGTPQPNEFVKIPAYFGIAYTIAFSTILHVDPNIEMLVFLATIIGVTSIQNLQWKNKSHGKES